MSMKTSEAIKNAVKTIPKKNAKNRAPRFTACMLAFFVVFYVFSVCACSESDRTDEENLPVVIIGSDDYHPYFCSGENGTFSGIDVSLATEALKRMGYKAVFKKINWTDKDEILNAGEVDCLWGSFSMNDRENKYSWAGPYLYSRQVVMVASNSDIYTLADLKGRSIGVQATSKPDEIFSKRTDPRIPEVKYLYCFVSMDNAFAAIRKGYVDAVAGHQIPLKVRVIESLSDEKEYRFLDEALMVSKLGVAFKKNTHAETIAGLNERFAEMRDDGFIRNLLEEYGIEYETAVYGGEENAEIARGNRK